MRYVEDSDDKNNIKATLLGRKFISGKSLKTIWGVHSFGRVNPAMIRVNPKITIG
ncbi:hypothetical protein QYF49_07635 [Fictibacillus sp. CENA-BCM004]|uniref:Uncharacterized protein n=1 Tax=Fictibacillus terranigra TaxID=3058424 RepID=A0ABT8E4R5_9BACL|nr:hypothetical protein [Fictibacillus sp. CENA-BCM004]MDN4072897.1 hypothetical protein [Fictibacillus sp. CENA-BCM004]